MEMIDPAKISFKMSHRTGTALQSAQRWASNSVAW